MVLPASLAHAPSVEPHWFDKVVVSIALSARGVLALVDHAAPSRLREAYLRLRGHDPATDLIVDVQRLAELPPATTVILAVTPSIGSDALDWLNLNRPVIADRRLNIVLWCEGDAAAVLACGAPDFFDWISARVDCPPAAAAFAVTEVKAAIRARAPGIAWAGPGLVETLAAVRKEPLPAKQPFFYLQRALSIRQRILATEDHISIAQLLGLIGQILAMQGDMADAREYLERSLEIRERLLGRDHPGIAPTLNALAQVQQATGDLLGARRLVHRALAIQTVTLDAGHPR